MVNVAVDFNKKIGKIKPMHAAGQPPYKGGFLSFDFSHLQHLTDAKIPYSRLHDVGGAFGINALYVAIGEIAVLLTLGTALFYGLKIRRLDTRLFG